MKNNYNFKKNQQPPSSEQIAQHQNFDAVLEQFQTAAAPAAQEATVVELSPWRRVYLWAGSAAAVLLIGWLIYTGTTSNQFLSAEDYFAQQSAFFEAQPYVKAPLPKAKAQFANFKMQANQGGTFEYESGSKLVVPAAAFMNDRGQLVEGEVDIKYREFHDYIDFFLSGIPMVYDSAGVQYNLESAGMMEIYAEQNGTRVQMVPGKSIDVELVSAVATNGIDIPQGFNIYKLDEAARAWVYQTIDDVQFADEAEWLSQLHTNSDTPKNRAKLDYQSALQQIKQREIDELQQIEMQYPAPIMPVEPRRDNGNAPSLELDFLDNLQHDDSNSHTLRQKYDGVVWQIAPNSPPFNENATQIIWEDFKLEQLNTRDFSLTLIKGDSELNIRINPVLSNEQYQAQMKIYKTDFEAFEQAQTKRQQAIAKAKTDLAASLTAERAQAKALFRERITKYNAAGDEATTTEAVVQRKVVNRFRASSLGTWNCDRPLPPYTHEIQGVFRNQNGKAYANRNGYIVNKTRNTIQKFYVTDGARIRFDRDSKNLMWLITADNKIARFAPQDFDQIESDQETFVFEMTELDQEIKHPTDVRKLLEF